MWILFWEFKGVTSFKSSNIQLSYKHQVFQFLLTLYNHKSSETKRQTYKYYPKLILFQKQ